MSPKVMATGKKDAKGRMIFRGPKGGLFVRTTGGRKTQPSTTPLRRRSKSPSRRR